MLDYLLTLAEEVDTLTTHQGQMLCIISFAVSRFIYLGLLRLPFDESSLADFLQYVDPQLLQNNLWESLYYLHSQPPGFNLFLGIVLKAFPESHTLVFQMVFTAVGLLFTLSLFTLMVQLGVSATISAALTILFSTSPFVVLYENWLYYGYPTAALLCLAAVLLHGFAVSTKLYTGLAFFSVLTLIAYTWPLFNLIWFVFFCLVILYILRAYAKTIALAFCLPLLALGTLYAKNYVVFGSFDTGRYLIAGLNLKKMTYYEIPENEHRSLIEQGKLTPISLIPSSSVGNIESYIDIIGAPPKTGVAVLDQVRKSSGAINFNYTGLLKAAKLVAKDDWYYLRTRPYVYLDAVVQNYKLYLLPASDSWMFEDLKSHRPDIQRLDHWYSLLLLGQRRASEPAYFLVVGCAVLLAFGFYVGAKAIGRKDVATFVALVFVVTNILYVTLVTMLFTYEDHNRYRFTVDAFYLTLLGLLISSTSAAVKTLWLKRKAQPQKRLTSPILDGSGFQTHNSQSVSFLTSPAW